MLLGQLLFVCATLAIVGSVAVGLVAGLSKVVIYKVTGQSLAAQPEPGSLEWVLGQSATSVDTAKRSLLTEPVARTAKDSVVNFAGERYRVTRLGGARFLVTQAGEGRRIGFFELDGSGRHQEVLAEPDDPVNASMLVKIAVLSSVVRRNAG
ncbi:MAG TPA: hypothetical protein VJT73_17410 [Polyangiaceae bacterium]|nr:hypothetical protein [Polyangiaceae bacterium]